MASRRLSTVCLVAIVASALGAQATIGTSVARPVPDFFFRLDASGKPLFTQVLHWEADPNASEYEILVKDSSGSQILDERVPASRVEVHLVPGSYWYKIVTYNLLDRAEAETPWNSLTVIKAEQPVITSTFPKTISLDALDWRVTIIGSRLLDKGRIALISPKGRMYPGAVKARKGEGEVVVVFPEEAYQPGIYALYAENPGGLSTTIEEALRVRLQKPVDFLASVDYSPFFALYDRWFVETWTPNFHPLSLDVRLELFFVKRPWGSLGLGLGAEERRMSGGFNEATLTSDFILAGAEVLYKYRFTRQIHGLARLGGGVSWSRHSFDYQGYTGPTTTSYDPFARAGLALQGFLPWKLYGEIGVDCSCIFLLDHYALGIAPGILVGYQLF